MSDLNKQNEMSNVFAESNERQKQRSEQRQQNIDRYQVFATDEQYDILNNLISQSNDPVEIENQGYRVANAMKYSEMYGMDLADAYRDLDMLNAANFGADAYKTPKDWFMATVDSFTQGVKQLERNSVGKQIREAEEAGNEKRVQELYQTIAGIDEEIASLEDTQNRNIAVKALKYGAQSLPFTGATIATSAVGGLLSGGIGAVVLGTVSSYEAMRGEEYLQLRQDGASVETAGKIADASALLQGIVEVSLGTVAGYAGNVVGKAPIAKSASDAITKNVFSRMYYGGAWKRAAAVVGKLGVDFLAEANEEGLEEVIQELVSSGARALSAELEDYGVDGLTASEVAKNAWESYKSGFLGALVLGAPNVAFNAKATVQDFKDFNSAAQNIESKEAFIKETSNSPLLDGMSDEAKVQAQEEVYAKFESQRNKRAEAERALAEDRAEVIDTSDNVEETVTDESGRVVRKDEYRNEDGSLNYVDRVYDTNEDGSTENQLIVKGKGNQEYGRIMYNEDADGNIVISDFTMSPTRENLRQEVFTDFAEKFAGRNIEWETRGNTAASVRESLVNNNVRGSQNGLNYFADKNEVQNQKTRMSWDRQIREAIPSMTSEQRSTGIALVESFANKHGKSLAEYDMDIFNGKLFIDKASREAYETALSQGMNPDNIGGYVDIEELGKSTKGIIYAAKKGDATTFVHENAHIFRRLLTADEMAQAEKLFNVTDHNWTRQNEEDFAYALQGYAFEGKAVGEAEPLFRKLAQALVRVYNSLKGKIDFNPELSDFIEGLFADPSTALAQAQRAVEQNERASQNQLLSNPEQLNETESVIDDTNADVSERVEEAINKAGDDVLNELYQFIDVKGAMNLTDRVKTLYDRAEQMRENGVDLETIRQLTGYSVGPDGVFQLELDDSQNEIIDRDGMQKAINAASFMSRAMANPGVTAQNLELLQYAMDKQLELLNADKNTVGKIYKAGELYTAKPELKNIRVGYVYDPRRIRAVQFEGGIGVNLAYVQNLEDLQGALVHELQHIIDLKVNTAGYNGDFFSDLNYAMEAVELNNKEYYADLVDDGGIVQYFLTDPYERNAHAAQRRMNLTAAQRRAYKLSDVVNNNYLFQNTDTSGMEEIRKQYEGTDQWLKAPNGADTKLTENQWLQVRTESFKNWFGDWESDPQNASKVVDENGEPMVVYHGTTENFDTFDFSKLKSTGHSAKGFHFVSNRNAAIKHGSYYEWQNKEEVVNLKSFKNLYNDALNLIDDDFSYDTSFKTKFENGNIVKYDVTTINADQFKERLENLLEERNLNEFTHLLMEVFSSKDNENYSKYYERLRRLQRKYWTRQENIKEVFLNIRKPSTDPNANLRSYNPNGADGQILRNVSYSSAAGAKDILTDIFIVPENPNQIKSATDNNGNFDAENDSILFQEINEADKTAEEKTDRENFFTNTAADFTLVESPETKPDYTSKSGSEYWYTDEGVYRRSTHWGRVASCNWYLNGNSYRTKPYGTNMRGEVIEEPNIPDDLKKYIGVSEDKIIDNTIYEHTLTGFCRWEDFNKNVTEDMPKLSVLFQEKDAEYIEAVNSGDLDKAQELVDERARQMGYTTAGNHGTLSEFTVFDRSKGNIEGDMGAGFYFTDNEADVEANYANEEGPDLKNKIDLLAEQLQSDSDNVDEEELDGRDFYDLDYEDFKEIARKRMELGEPRTINAYLKIDNPVIIGDNSSTDWAYETTFTYEESYDEETDEYGEPEGSLVDFIEEIKSVASGYNDTEDIDFNSLYELGYDGEVGAQDLIKAAKELLTYAADYDNDGKLAGNEIIRQTFENLGYDAIVDHTVGEKFERMEGIDYDTTHYIVFKPEQIKKSDPVTYDENGNVIQLSERFNEDSPSILFQGNEDTFQDRVNQTMTMDRAKEMIHRTFAVSNIKQWYDGQYKNGDEWLAGEGVDDVAMYIENEYVIMDKYINPLYKQFQELYDGEMTIYDIVEAYKNGTLTGKKKEEAFKSTIDLSKEFYTNDERFYAPKEIDEDSVELLKKASQRVTKTNKDEVNKARADFVTKAHNIDFAETVGLTQSEVNSKIKQWTLYPNKVREASMRFNNGVSRANQWTGLENSHLLKSWTITEDELRNMVKGIEGESSEWQRNYIVSTMLALDTHIDYSELTYVFNDKTPGHNNAAGYYKASEKTIYIRHDGQNTVAHETGHYIDNKWGKELLGRDDYLTENRFLATKDIEDTDLKSFFNHFFTLLDSIEDVAQATSEYDMSSKEVFARFVAKFTEWTRVLATNNRYQFEDKWYKDKFTTAQFVDFVKLLQEKSYLDNKKKEKSTKNTPILFQYLQDELDADTLKEAADFTSWEEWYEYAKAMDTDGVLSGAWDDVSEQNWFKSAWESAQKIYNAEPAEDPELQADKDKQFVELIKKPGYLEDFLERAKRYMGMQLDQPSDETEAAEFDRIMDMQRFTGNVMADPAHFANDLDDTQKKKLLTMIESSPREYRAIYAEVFGDANLAVPEGMEYTVDTSVMPEEMALELDAMTPAQRREAVKAVEDEQIRQQIESGSLPMDATLDRYIKVVDTDNKKLKKEIERLKSEYREDLERINNAQKKALLEEYERLQEMAAEMQGRNLKGNGRVSSGLSAGAMATSNVVDASENGNYNTVMDRIASLKKMFAGERDAAAIIAKADERAKQKVLQQKKKAEADALREMKKLRTNTVKRMVRKVSFTNVNYDEAKKIIAIQNFIDHWVRNGVNLWLGEAEVTANEIYNQYTMDSDFRDEVDKTLTSRKAGAKGQRVLRNLRDAISDDEGLPFSQWTPKMKNDLIEALGANDQVIRLNLDALKKQRQSAIHSFIAKNGTVTEENMKTVYESLPKDVIARIRYTPMNKWTLAQAEELARYIDAIYEDGKKIYAGRQQLRRDRYEELRRRIQDAVKDTGIRIEDDDTPEEIRKKQEKIAKILGLRTQGKGTAASAAEKRSMREKFMAADRGTGNVRRFARVMDNWTEGVFTDTLCFSEYMAWDDEQKAINERSRHVQDYMKEHGITMEKLVEKHTYPGLMDGQDVTYTTDELLYIYIANMDEMSQAAVMYGNFTTAEEKESVKQHEQKYADKEAIKWFMANAENRFNRVLLDAEEIINTDKDLAGLVQVIENDYEKQYERLNRVSIDVFNTPVNRVSAYVPLYRLEQTGDTNEQQVAKDILANTTGTPSNYVGRGMTKNRVEISPTNQKPVQLGLFKTWADSMEKTEHFIAYGELVRDLNAIYTSQAASATREAIASRYGQDANNYIKEYINELANPNKGQPKTALDTIVHVMRGQTAPAYLAWKTSGIIKQLCTSPWPFMAYVSPAEYLTSIGEFIKDYSGMNDFVKSRSVFMANRTIDPIIDLIKEAQMNADNKVKASLASFNKMGMQGLEWADWVSVAPGWYAAYKQKTAEIEKVQKNMDPLADGYKDSEAIEREAIAYADDVVRLTQPSGRKADLSPVFKNSAEIAKILLQFQTSLNVIYQNIRFDLPYQIRNHQYRQAAGAVIGYTAAGILVNAVVSGLFTGDGGDDEPEEKLKRAVFYATTQFTDSVPVVGQQLTNVVQKVLTGEGYYSNSTLFPVVDVLTKTVSDVAKDNYAKAAEDFGEGVAYTLGLPVSGSKELLRVFGIGDREEGMDFKPQALWGRR